MSLGASAARALLSVAIGLAVAGMIACERYSSLSTDYAIEAGLPHLAASSARDRLLYLSCRSLVVDTLGEYPSAPKLLEEASAFAPSVRADKHRMMALCLFDGAPVASLPERQDALNVNYEQLNALYDRFAYLNSWDKRRLDRAFSESEAPNGVASPEGGALLLMTLSFWARDAIAQGAWDQAEQAGFFADLAMRRFNQSALSHRSRALEAQRAFPSESRLAPSLRSLRLISDAASQTQRLDRQAFAARAWYWRAERPAQTQNHLATARLIAAKSAGAHAPLDIGSPWRRYAAELASRDALLSSEPSAATPAEKTANWLAIYAP